MLVFLFHCLLLYLSFARYQATSVAETYQTLGYLVPIIASLCVCILPRAKFIEMMLLNTARCSQSYAIYKKSGLIFT